MAVTARPAATNARPNAMAALIWSGSRRFAGGVGDGVIVAEYGRRDGRAEGDQREEESRPTPKSDCVVVAIPGDSPSAHLVHSSADGRARSRAGMEIGRAGHSLDSRVVGLFVEREVRRDLGVPDGESSGLLETDGSTSRAPRAGFRWTSPAGRAGCRVPGRRSPRTAPSPRWPGRNRVRRRP